MHPPFWETRLFLMAMLTISLTLAGVGLATVFARAEGGWPALLTFGMCAAIFFAKLYPSVFNRHHREVRSLIQAFPAPVTLRANRIKHVLMLAGCFIFCGLCLWILHSRDTSLFPTIALGIGIVVFGLCGVILIPIVIYGQTLLLTAEGFTFGFPARRKFIAWDDVGTFETVTVPASGVRLVVFDEVRLSHHRIDTESTRLIGHTSALPDTYGLTADELALVLNKWRKRGRGQRKLA